MRGTRVWVVLLIVTGWLAWTAPQSQVEAAEHSRPALQTSTLVMVSPGSCPSSGCAPGQRLNLRLNFPLTAYNSALTTANVRVCFYAPESWNIETIHTDPILGGVSQDEYRQAQTCGDAQVPTGYELLLAREATINTAETTDTIDFAFRLTDTVSQANDNHIEATVYESTDGLAFTRMQQANFTAIPNIAAPASNNTYYIANDSAACGTRSPCYINSGDDLLNGVGTGLRDAVDAVPGNSTLTLLGDYSIKSHTIIINKPIILTGINNATLTTSSNASCSTTMLSLQSDVTVRGLNINDGTCTNPNRSLIDVNSNELVVIESNNLSSGGNAIFIFDRPGNVMIQYNHITGNSGYAIYAQGSSTEKVIEIIGNNLHNNRVGDPIQCADAATQPLANRKANHNYFGATSPTAAATHCTLDTSKRLGAPVLLRENQPGVQIDLVVVGETTAHYFDNEIGVRRIGGSDFSLYIVNHGYVSDTNAPFSFNEGLDSPSPCSNYWDVFLPEGENPTGALELRLKYDKTDACIDAINSSQYCGQTAAPGRYPLYWFDPTTNGVTNGWDTTGQRPERLTTGEGQPTSCNTAASEMLVTIDTGGRPALNTDLGFTPFMVGIPIVRTFQAITTSQTVTAQWTTNNEPDVTGFYVQRSTDRVNFTRVSGMVARRGSTTVGVTSPVYSFANTNLANGTTYYYRLETLRADGYSVYSNIIPVIVNVATSIPTRTNTPILPTRTPTRTFVPQQFPTLIPSPSATIRTIEPTVTPFQFGTPEVDLTGTFERTMTPDTSGTPVAMVGTATETPTPTVTVAIFPETVAGGENNTRPWLSLGLGLLAGTLVIGGLGGLWWFTKAR